MTERVTNYRCARLSVLQLGTRAAASCQSPSRPGRQGAAKPDWEEARTDTDMYPCGRMESRPRSPLPFPDISALEATLITREGETEPQRGP